MRLLLVEDEPPLAHAIARHLTHDGFAVDVTHDGIDALHKAGESAYDVIALDIMLPGLSGYDVLRGLRARHDWTPVLMLTAKDGEWDIADALDLGADDYLVKPFSHVVLLARLRALLRRGGPERPAVLTVGELLLDPATRQVQVRDVEVTLTTREFSVLEYLARRAGEVVSKADLLAHVWDEFFDGDPNIVEVYIGYLRRKVDVPFGRVSIDTVRGAGYRLRPDAG